jgi:hypothetical protein
MTRLLTWWKTRQMRALRYNAYCAAVAYTAAKTRYENALIVAAMPPEGKEG